MTSSEDRAVDENDNGVDQPDHNGDDASAKPDAADDDGTTEHDSGDPVDAGDSEATVGLPPIQPVAFEELLAAYIHPTAEGSRTLPWSWVTLTPAEGAANATLIDSFVESYNETWAIRDGEVVPPCWHRHPALAHDLAALAWAYHQAYRDRDATALRALRFQSQLPLFAQRLDRWLGSEPAECRAGRHPSSWRDAAGATRSPDRSNPEDADAVVLLADEAFGFGRPS